MLANIPADLIFLAPTAAATITLPSVAGLDGKVVVFKSNGSKAITLAAASNEKIDGATTFALASGTTRKSVMLRADAAGLVWDILAQF